MQLLHSVGFRMYALSPKANKILVCIWLLNMSVKTINTLENSDLYLGLL